MQAWIHTSLASALLVAVPAAAVSSVPEPAPRSACAELARHEDPSLAELRAGAPLGAAALDLAERDSLAAAQASATDLADLRAGELDNNDLTVIAVIALAIIAVAIIL